MQVQDLFISGQEGYHTYRIPALAVAPDGAVLAFCEARRHTGRDDDQIDILLRRSADGGRTWEPRQRIVADGERTCGNPCPVVDHDRSAVLLPFCKDNQEVFVSRSTDSGRTWTDPVEITSQVKASSWTYLGTGPGHGIQLQSGRLLVPSWVDESPGPATWRQPPPTWGQVQSSIAFYSDDGGYTWQVGAKLTHDASDECEAVEMADGSLYMTLRSRNERHCRGWSRSRDGGATWSVVSYEQALPEPSCQGSIVRLDDGRILMAHPSKPDERAELTLWLSEDQGHSWPVARVLEPGAAAYSDLAVAPDGQVLCLYEAEHSGCLRLARFAPAWLEEEP